MSDEEDFWLRLPLDEHIIGDGIEWLLEKKIKHQGVWVIHKYDKDDVFPSDLHAHREDGNETLDIYTGEIYDPKNKTFKRKLSKKAMKHIYAKIEKSGDQDLIDRLALNKDNFTYL